MRWWGEEEGGGGDGMQRVKMVACDARELHRVGYLLVATGYFAKLAAPRKVKNGHGHTYKTGALG